MTPTAPAPAGLRLLALWLGLAALGQVMYLGHWPMRLLGVEIPWTAAVWVALVRLGVYAGLCSGLLERKPRAWAGTILELWRTFFLFVAMILLRQWSLAGLAYPAGWAQGLLSAGLPPIMGVNLSLDAGWWSARALEFPVMAAVHVLAGLSGFSALWLRREAPRFGIAHSEEGRTLLRDGLPVVLLLAAAEAAAILAVLY